VRENVQPRSLVHHHAAHDVVERVALPRLGVVKLKEFLAGSLCELEYGIGRLSGIAILVIGEEFWGMESARQRGVVPGRLVSNAADGTSCTRRHTCERSSLQRRDSGTISTARFGDRT
jgi:hypothetical protein